MTAPRRRPGMVDVAAEAGVALVTVSRVVNGHPSVREETRAKVLEVIERLGYRRNDVAAALKQGTTATIGVVIAGSELFELSRILHGIEEAAGRAGLAVALANWHGGEPERLEAAVDGLAAQGARGVAIIADRPVAAAALDRMVARVPVAVVMSGELENAGIGSVELDQRRGALLAVRHLVALGHEDIALLAGRLGTHDARARVDGWRDGLAEAGFAARLELAGDFTPESGYALATEIAATDRRPTAILAGNDQMAIGAIAALDDLGLRVPDDISVVGFDDILGSAYVRPPLTTVRQDFRALGETGIEVLLGLIDGSAAAHHLIEPTLVVRRSSAPPR